MKLYFALLIGLVSTSAFSHDYWPDDYSVYKGQMQTLVVTHLRSQDDAYFKFTLNGIPLGNEQFVSEGSVEDFPIIVPNGLIDHGKVIICSKRLRSTDQFEQEVCLKIEVME